MRTPFCRAGVCLFAAGAVAFSLSGAKQTKTVDGFADEEGNFVSDSADKMTKVVRPSDWGVKPLGAPGKLVVDKTLKVKPTFRSRPVRKPGPTLIGGGKVVTVVAPTAVERPLAEEIAWHLTEMTGKSVPVMTARPVSGPAIVLSGAPDDDKETSVLETKGETVTLAGTGAGLSHAVTYFLEQLGVRYLYPGREGKVIPTRETVVYPETNFSFAPVLRVRGIRGGPVEELKKWRPRTLKAARDLGMDPEAYREAVNSRYYDRAGNRDFFEWHGLRDNPDCFGAAGPSGAKYKWGHSFKWTNSPDFSQKHPEFCALQPDGTREVKNGRWDRACFCLSNPAFIQRTIEETVKDFDRRVGKLAIAIGLPDGGGGSMCMCENCRKLDPVNATPRDYMFRAGEVTPYVEMTDRVLWFFNQVIDGALKARPDRKGLTFFPYSNYIQPPVAVAPDRRLIALSVAGNYVNARSWAAARENVAAWMNLGLETYWRPNLMWGWKLSGPQNFARRLFDDYEALKANGLKGTDFDCVANNWGTKGLNVYINCRCALNPDRLDYETIFDDYCTAGFGPAAADVKAYFNAVEAMNEKAAKEADRLAPSVKDFRQKIVGECYLDALDLELLDGHLARAEKAAAGDAAVLARLALLKASVGYARCEKRLRALEADETPEGQHRFRGAQRAYADFICRSVRETPMACCPTATCVYNPYMYTFKSARKAKKRK